MVISPEGAATVRATGCEAKELLQPVLLAGRSAEDLQQEGLAVASDPICLLECGSPFAMVPSSDAESQESWTKRGAPHDLAPSSSLNQPSVRLEPGDPADVAALSDLAEPSYHEWPAARRREPPAIRAAASAARQDALSPTTTRLEPPTAATADYAEKPQCRPPLGRVGVSSPSACSPNTLSALTGLASRCSGGLFIGEAPSGAGTAKGNRLDSGRGKHLSSELCASRAPDIDQVRRPERACSCSAREPMQGVRRECAMASKAGGVRALPAHSDVDLESASGRQDLGAEGASSPEMPSQHSAPPEGRGCRGV